MENSELRVPWKQVSIGASIVALAALAALVVVASTNDSDVLSTVALSLAILAFVVQIMVFLAQSWSAGQSALQSHEINASTHTVLAELKARATGTERILERQVDQTTELLTNLVEARKEGLTTDQTANRLEALYDDDGAEPAHRAARASPDDLAVIERLNTYPTEEEAAPYLNKFLSLSPLGGATLRLLGEDERDSRRIGWEGGLPTKEPTSPGVVELENVGFAEPTDPDEDDDKRRWVALTPQGLEAARLILGAGPVPGYLVSALTAQSD